jgi:hypothetical protein
VFCFRAICCFRQVLLKFYIGITFQYFTFYINIVIHILDLTTLRKRVFMCSVVVHGWITYLTVNTHNKKSRVSSGSIVSDYGLDDRTIEVRSPAGAKDFSSNLCVQTGSGAHPASCTMGTGVLSPGVKHDRGVTLTTHPHLVPRSWMRSYTSSSPKRLHGV